MNHEISTMFDLLKTCSIIFLAPASTLPLRHTCSSVGSKATCLTEGVRTQPLEWWWPTSSTDTFGIWHKSVLLPHYIMKCEDWYLEDVVCSMHCVKMAHAKVSGDCVKMAPASIYSIGQTRSPWTHHLTSLQPGMVPDRKAWQSQQLWQV